MATKANGVIFISGDVHRGELSLKDAGVGYPIFDLTSSGLTQATPGFRFVWPNRYSVGVMGWGKQFWDGEHRLGAGRSGTAAANPRRIE